MSETATIDAVETVDATPETAPEQTAPEQPTEPTVQAVDVDKVKVAETIEAASNLLKAANADSARRAELDANAYALLGKHLVNRWGNQQVVTEEVELPAYGTPGVGSVRYTKQRAYLLMTIAAANYVASDLRWRHYGYPGNTGRRQYRVVLIGARVDVDRTVAMFTALQARAIKDAYDTEVLPTANLKRPVDQTKARREWMIGFSGTIGEALEDAFQTLIDDRKAGNALSERETKAQAAMEEFKARKADDEGDESVSPVE